MKLEQLFPKIVKLREKTEEAANRVFYRYCVDVSSGWAYYTPIYAFQEAISGKDIETIVKTRAIGLLAHTLVMRPIGKIRDYAAKKMNVTRESSKFDKLKVNLIAVTPMQSLVYGAMLVGGMAWANNYDWKSPAISWGLGVGLGAAHAFPYGVFQDKYRAYFKTKPAIN